MRNNDLMMVRAFVLVVNALSLAACAGSNTVVSSNGSFDAFQCRLTGHWDNVRQARSDSAAGAVGEYLHPRRAMSYYPVFSPNIEGRLFAIHSYADKGLAGPLSRIALHRFRPVGEVIVHEFLFLLDRDQWGDLSKDLTTLRDLTEDDVRINRDCAMYWRSEADHFEGSTVPGRCITRSFTPEPIRIEGHGILLENQLIRHDQNYSLAGEPISIPGGAAPEQFDRVTEGERAAIPCIQSNRAR